MWKPALFLITIVLVTPNGRNLFSEYSRQATALIDGGAMYGELAVAALGLIILGLFLLMLCQSPKNQEAQWIVRRVQGEEPAAAYSNRSR